MSSYIEKASIHVFALGARATEATPSRSHVVRLLELIVVAEIASSSTTNLLC